MKEKNVNQSITIINNQNVINDEILRKDNWLRWFYGEFSQNHQIIPVM